MLACLQVGRSDNSATLPQHATEITAIMQRQQQPTATRSLLDGHDKLKRLGEAVTDVICAGVEVVFDKCGTQRMSQRIHAITKNMQLSGGEVFHAPYARLQAAYLDQQKKIEELNAQLSVANTLPQGHADQSALIDELRGAVSGFEQRVHEQQIHIQHLEAKVEEGKGHEELARRREAEIDALVDDLDKQRAAVEDHEQLSEDLQEAVADLEDMKDTVAERDATIANLRQQIADDGKTHRQQVAAHERAVADLQRELHPLRSRVEEQLAHISELSVEAQAATTHEARVAEQAKLIEDLQAMLAQDRMLEAKVNEQDVMMDELRGALSAGEAELQQQREDAAALQRELSEANKENKTLSENVEKLTAELETARGRVKALEVAPSPSPRRQLTTLPPSQRQAVTPPLTPPQQQQQPPIDPATGRRPWSPAPASQRQSNTPVPPPRRQWTTAPPSQRLPGSTPSPQRQSTTLSPSQRPASPSPRRQLGTPARDSSAPSWRSSGSNLSG